jgi:hypothetical protein
MSFLSGCSHPIALRMQLQSQADSPEQYLALASVGLAEQPAAADEKTFALVAGTGFEPV